MMLQILQTSLSTVMSTSQKVTLRRGSISIQSWKHLLPLHNYISSTCQQDEITIMIPAPPKDLYNSQSLPRQLQHTHYPTLLDLQSVCTCRHNQWCQLDSTIQNVKQKYSTTRKGSQCENVQKTFGFLSTTVCVCACESPCEHKGLGLRQPHIQP